MNIDLLVTIKLTVEVEEDGTISATEELQRRYPGFNETVLDVEALPFEDA